MENQGGKKAVLHRAWRGLGLESGTFSGSCVSALHSWHTCEGSVPHCEAASGGAFGSTEGRDAGAVAWERERFCDSSPGRERCCPLSLPLSRTIKHLMGPG